MSEKAAPSTAEPVITQQPQAKPFFIHPTQNFDAEDIKKSVNDAITNLKEGGSGLSGTNGSPSAFKTGLFDCFTDVPTCLLAWCCSPCLFHRTYHVMNRQPNEFPEEDFVGGTCLSFCASSCTCFGACLWTALRRGAIREKYNLAGDTRMDFALSCCCGPCIIAQDDLEVRHIEKKRLLEYQSSQQSVGDQTL